MMTYRTYWLLFVVIGGVFFYGQYGEKIFLSPKTTQSIRIWNWSDYVPADVLEDFEKETGIQVFFDPFDDLSILEAHLISGHSGYDVVFPTATYVGRGLLGDFYAPLDFSQIPNANGLDPRIMEALRSVDPGLNYCVPYLWGALGIAYNETILKEKGLLDVFQLDSWSCLFNPQKAALMQPCHFTLMDSPIEGLQTALIFLGIHPNSEAMVDLFAGIHVFEAVQPYVYRFNSQIIDQLVSGEVLISQCYASLAKFAQRMGEKVSPPQIIRFQVPKEGSVLSIDTMAIPKNAPNPKGAHAFINFILSPRIIARISETFRMANAVPASWPLISRELREDPHTFLKSMDGIAFERLPNPAFGRLQMQAWIAMKMGYGSSIHHTVFMNRFDPKKQPIHLDHVMKKIFALLKQKQQKHQNVGFLGDHSFFGRSNDEDAETHLEQHFDTFFHAVESDHPHAQESSHKVISKDPVDLEDLYAYAYSKPDHPKHGSFSGFGTPLIVSQE